MNDGGAYGIKIIIYLKVNSMICRIAHIGSGHHPLVFRSIIGCIRSRYISESPPVRSEFY